MVTETLRALRMEPIDAAVIPFPSDETTPPVTKTYFDNLDLPGVFQMLPAVRLVTNLQERCSRRNTFVSASPEPEYWTTSLGWGTASVTPISLRKVSTPSRSSFSPGTR